jgi:hypothetical protein
MELVMYFGNLDEEQVLKLPVLLDCYAVSSGKYFPTF